MITVTILTSDDDVLTRYDWSDDGPPELVIGRGDRTQVTVDHSSISSRHCRLTRGGEGELNVEDLDSTNGTFVSGERIDRTTLSPGDSFRIGELTVLLGSGTDAESPSADPSPQQEAVPEAQGPIEMFLSLFGPAEEELTREEAVQRRRRRQLVKKVITIGGVLLIALFVYIGFFRSSGPTRNESAMRALSRARRAHYNHRHREANKQLDEMITTYAGTEAAREAKELRKDVRWVFKRRRRIRGKYKQLMDDHESFQPTTSNELTSEVRRLENELDSLWEESRTFLFRHRETEGPTPGSPPMLDLLMFRMVRVGSGATRSYVRLSLHEHQLYRDYIQNVREWNEKALDQGNFSEAMKRTKQLKSALSGTAFEARTRSMLRQVRKRILSSFRDVVSNAASFRKNNQYRKALDVYKSVQGKFAGVEPWESVLKGKIEEVQHLMQAHGGSE